MKTYFYKLSFIALMVTLSSCNNSEETTIKTTVKPINVTVSQVSTDADKSYLTVSGHIAAVNSAKLSTRVMGHVDQVHVGIGDKVQKGQQMITLNNADLKAKKAQVAAGIAEANAAFIIAEKDYNRFKTLYDQNSASQKELDDITAHYIMAKARLQASNEMKNEVEAQFAYTNVIAPFDGVVTARFIDQGDLASPGMPLMAIESPNSFEVIARVPENLIASFQKGLKAQVVIPSINTTLPGVVSKVSASSSFTGGQYIVKLQIESFQKPLRSGMFVSVDFPSISSKYLNENETVLIPKSILINKGGLTGIYTVSQQNTAVLRWLRLGRQYGDQIEVLSGLSSNETYIVSADGKLYNGTQLNLQKNK